MKPTSLKALAQAVLERNQERNRGATGEEKQCNLTTPKSPPKLRTPGEEVAPKTSATQTPKVAPELRGSATKKNTQQQPLASQSCIVALCGNATVQPARKASGYGCGSCGENLYHETPAGWECSGCGKVFAIIGGSKGPLFH